MNVKEKSSLIQKLLDDNKMENIIEIDLEGKTDIARYMIVATGRSERHNSAVAEKISDILKDENIPHQIEGTDKKDWVVMDLHDVIIHLFKQETRELYKLEDLWNLAKRS